jgi:hypothetical protein
MKRSAIKPGKGFKPRSEPMARGNSTLKSYKGLSRGSAKLTTTKPLKPSGKKMAPVGARGKRMRQGKVPPTAAEKAWMDRAQAHGCVVCLLQTGTRMPAEIHHIKAGDRRMGHLFTLPLCTAHHRGGEREGAFISRHPWKARFEQAYGTELELLAILQNLLQ